MSVNSCVCICNECLLLTNSIMTVRITPIYYLLLNSANVETEEVFNPALQSISCFICVYNSIEKPNVIASYM